MARKLVHMAFRVKPIEKDAALMKSLSELLRNSFSARYLGESDVRLRANAEKPQQVERSI